MTYDFQLEILVIVMIRPMNARLQGVKDHMAYNGNFVGFMVE